MMKSIHNSCIITIDIDWAPDFAIDKMAAVLINKKVKATWFVTHNSPAIDRLKKYPDLFELGIHPNFLPNSSHGKTVKEAIAFFLDFIPGAISMRTHALVQSGPLLKEIVEQSTIQIDTSILLRETINIQPHTMRFEHSGKKLIRVPFYWEDDVEMYNPAKTWIINKQALAIAGIKVFNFHPMYCLLNSDTMVDYEGLKKIKPLYELEETDVAPYINKEAGANSYFEQVTSYIRDRQEETFMIKDFLSYVD